MKNGPPPKSSFRSKAADILSYLWPAAACLIPLSMAAYVVAGYSPAQNQDQWREIFWLKSFYAGEAHISDLWRLHNRHPIFFPRLFYLIDTFAFRATNIFLLPSAFLIQASACALLVREICAERDLSRPLARFLAGVYLIFLFSARQYGNFTWGFQVQFVLVFAAAVAAAVAFARHGDSRADTHNERKWLFISLACATVCTFSMANGMFIWPALAVVSLASRRRRRDTIAIGAAFVAAILILLLMGFKGGDVGQALSHPIAVFLFFLRYLGSPFTTSMNLAAVIGAAGLALGTAACAFCLLRPDRLSRFRRAHVVLIIFVFFSAAATGIGRFDARNASPLAGRYATASFIFWASALSLLLHEASHRPRWRRVAIPGIVSAVVIVCAISIVPLHIAGGARAVATKHILDEASLALVSGVRDERYLQSLYFPDTDELLSVVPMLREKRLSMFRPDWANCVGKELTSSFAVSGGDECLGQFDGAKPLSGSGKSAVTDLRVSGWAWDQRAEKPCPLVLIVDDAGVIRGIARSGYPREDLLARVDNKRIKDSGWVGFATCEKGCRLRAYAVSVDESTAYRIGGVYVKR